MRKLLVISSLLIGILLQNCKSSQVTSTWKAKDLSAKEYNKIMVVGIIREADRTIREQMEKHLVEDLRLQGLNAFSSYVEYGPKTFENMNEQGVNEKLAAEGIDGVLTIVLLNKEKERYYVPARVVYTPYVTYHDRFWRYYSSVYTRIESPDYYGVSTKYFWESNFYDLKENKLVYSVQTQTFAPASASSMAHEYGQLIIKNIISNNIFSHTVKQPVKAI
jgi:hypothetical protein